MRQHTLSKYISRLVAVLMMTLLLCCAPVAYADGESGECGENLNWSLTGGTLTITGSGDMTDYTLGNPAPWYELREEIYFVILPEGMTSVGELAFYECGRLQRVKIPQSVTAIGNFAFAYCADLVMLDLGGVSAIGEAAFSDCYDLAALRLPDSLRTIGKKAFYRCESLTALTVPEGVTEIGVAAFGYCRALVTADVRAQVDELPALMFYGCDRLDSVKLPQSVQTLGYHTFLNCEQLSTVYYNGTQQTPEQIQQSIGADVPNFGTYGTVTDGESGKTAQSDALLSAEDNKITYENTTVTQGDSSTVTTTVTTTKSESGQTEKVETDVSITLDGQNGWQEAAGVVQDALEKAESGADADVETGSVDITIYLPEGESVDKEFIDSLAGKDVTITIINQNGSGWRVNGQNIDPESGAKTYDLGYELTLGSQELCEKLGVSTCYVLRFGASAQINAELMVRLSGSMAMQNATLLKGKDFEQIQSSVVDQGGYAHFYLASVDKRSEYYIAINLPGVQDSAIIPEELTNAYGNPIFHEPLQYEITGRTSSWNMTFGQVTWIMIGVLVACVVAVGAVMFALNKRKLKMGYIPDLGDEEE